MQITASCMFPLHQETLLQHWMVCSPAWPLSSRGYQRTNWNWTQMKLNSSLSEKRTTVEQIPMFSIELFSVKTNPSKSARNVGVIFDKNFTFRSHISAVCSPCFYHIRDLWGIRDYLDLYSVKLLATALVSSRLNYCNSILYCITDTDLTKLQHVQNRPAGIMTKSAPLTCGLPLLRSLHWLPVKFRIL